MSGLHIWKYLCSLSCRPLDENINTIVKSGFCFLFCLFFEGEGEVAQSRSTVPVVTYCFIYLVNQEPKLLTGIIFEVPCYNFDGHLANQT